MQAIPDKEELINFIRKVSLFQHADQTILANLSEKASIESVPAGVTIIHKGDEGSTMYLIFSGRLKVHDGEYKVAELGEGQFFGELSLLDSEPRSMSVTTEDVSLIGSLTRADFYEVLDHFPAMTLDIISVLNNRLRNQNKVLIDEFKNREDELKRLVEIRTAELENKNKELEVAMENLKRSQQQLIQSEKLASLGQLTAGIAHEIQNPLNFVNNFSELSSIIIDDMKDIDADDERAELLNDLKLNLQKINQHGKRADSIVKSMLEHSRTATGVKQSVNINNLCKEYFNLAYHGLLATTPDFSCHIDKNTDENLPLINVIAQDVSRVLLNIFNNAFYSVKQKSLLLNKDGVEKVYEPAVSLTTSLQDGCVRIQIRDNGQGIPKAIREKIFQPFFSTKPTGDGTGLGLSLSHDIVSAHGGSIQIESTEGEYAEFIITLPI
jgi:signal transduction histidine kinase